LGKLVEVKSAAEGAEFNPHHSEDEAACGEIEIRADYGRGCGVKASIRASVRICPIINT
jgi:hypothetical protein